MREDEFLYYAYLNGSENELNELMERYGNSLMFYINGYVHDLCDAEDLMIEAFAYLIAKRPKIRAGGFKPYLYKSARHMALRFLHRKGEKSTFGFDNLSREPESNILIEEVVSTQERNRILNICLDRLNPDYKEALYLVYFENMRHKEAATVMGKSEKQVQDLIYRGRNSLKKHLEKEGVTNA